MIKCSVPMVAPYLINKNSRNEIVLTSPFMLDRSIEPNENQVYFERMGKNDFKMHVLSGNSDEIAKCLNIVS